MCEAFEMNQNLGISAKAKFVDFHLLGCSLVKFGPDVKFLGSTDSCDPEDFKNSLKKAKKVPLHQESSTDLRASAGFFWLI